MPESKRISTESFYHLASDPWERNDLLEGTLNATEQANYDGLNTLLDRQDRGDLLSDDERREAEGLVALVDLLALLRLRAERILSP